MHPPLPVVTSALSLIRKGLSPELIQAVRFLSLVVFGGLAIRVSRAADPALRRRRIDTLILFLLAINAGVILVRTDAWPFSPYSMMAVDATDHSNVRTMIAFRAVDRQGREWKVDPLAWSPLFPQAIMGWFEVVYPFASPADREEAGRFLLARAEEARARRVAGRRIGNDRWLGFLAAPDTNLYWEVPQTSAEAFVSLRVYRLFWRPTELAADPGRFGRRLLLECRAE